MEEMSRSFCESYLSDYMPLREHETYEQRFTKAMQRLARFMDAKYCSILDLELKRPEKPEKREVACCVGPGAVIVYDIERHRELYETLAFRIRYTHYERPLSLVTATGFPRLEIITMEEAHARAAECDYSAYDNLFRLGASFEGQLHTLLYRKGVYRWERRNGAVRLHASGDSNFWTKELCTLSDEADGTLTIWRKHGQSVVLQQRLRCASDLRFLSLKLYRHVILVHCYRGGGILVLKRNGVDGVEECGCITCHNDEILSYGFSDQEPSIVVLGTRRGWVLYVDIETCQTVQQHLLKDGMSAESILVRGSKAFVLTGTERRLISAITRGCDTVELIESHSPIKGLDARHGMMAFICEDGSTYLTMIGHWNLYKLNPISAALGPFGRYREVQHPHHLVTVRDWAVTFILPSGSVRCVQVRK